MFPHIFSTCRFLENCQLQGMLIYTYFVICTHYSPLGSLAGCTSAAWGGASVAEVLLLSYLCLCTSRHRMSHIDFCCLHQSCYRSVGIGKTFRTSRRCRCTDCKSRSRDLGHRIQDYSIYLMISHFYRKQIIVEGMVTIYVCSLGFEHTTLWG